MPKKTPNAEFSAKTGGPSGSVTSILRDLRGLIAGARRDVARRDVARQVNSTLVLL